MYYCGHTVNNDEIIDAKDRKVATRVQNIHIMCLDSERSDHAYHMLL